MTTSKIVDDWEDAYDDDDDDTKQPTTTTTESSSTIIFSYPSPYTHCSEQECKERQELKQISVFETTIDTGHLPQQKRQLDPRLAITKFRRSAAGSSNKKQDKSSSHARGQQQQISTTTTKNDQNNPYTTALESTLTRLLYILVHQRASPNHPIQTLWTTAEFVSDRLRACQVEATAETTEDHVLVPIVSPYWHLRLIRCLLILRYLARGMGSERYELVEQTSITMIWTAFHEYWVAVDAVGHNTGDEISRKQRQQQQQQQQALKENDELLYLTTLCHLSNWLLSPQEHSLGWILSHAYKHMEPHHQAASQTVTTFEYPLWQSSLKWVALATRQEYGSLLLQLEREAPVLGRCCLAGALSTLRYHSLSQYNTGFAKKEVVRDMDRLLGYHGRNSSYTLAQDCQSFGLPVDMVMAEEEKTKDDGDDETKGTATTTKKAHVVMKQTAMVNDKLPLPPRRDDDHWVFGGLTREQGSLSRVDDDGVSIPSSAWIQRVLDYGCYTPDSS